MRSRRARRRRCCRWCSASGAAVSTICNPVFGAFSDRTTWRMGRRLPWILIGAAGGSVSLLALSTASSVPAMLIGWCGVQVFLNAMYAAVMAAIPDQVPVERRGLIGGLVAIAQTVGIVGGVAIASLTGSIAAGLPRDDGRAAGPDDPVRPRLARPRAAGRSPAAAVLAGAVPAVVLDLAAPAPRLRVGLDHPVPGQPRQLRRHALPALLRRRRPRHPRGRGGRPGARADRALRRHRRSRPPRSSATGATGSGAARSS